jgi:hypothetical protein
MMAPPKRSVGRPPERVALPIKEEHSTEEENEDPELPAGQEDDRSAEDLEEYSAKFSEFQRLFSGKSYKVRVERFSEQNSVWAWCRSLPLDGFDPLTFVEKYGSGRYRCTLLNERGLYVPKARTEFFYIAPPEPPKEETKGSFLQDPAIQFLIESQKAQSNALMEILKAALAGGQAKTNDITQIIEAVKSIKSMAGDPKTGPQSIKEVLDLAVQLKDLASGEKAERGSTGLVGELAEALKLVTTLRGSAEPAALPGPQPPVRTVSTRPMHVLSPNVEDAMPKCVNEVLFYVPKFVKAAARNEDSETWAEFLLDLLDREVIPSLVEQYSAFGLDEKGAMDRLLAAGKDPTRIDKIFIYAPALNPHRAWVRAVIEKAIDIVERELSVGPGEEVPEPESKNGTKPEDIPAHKDGEPT